MSKEDNNTPGLVRFITRFQRVPVGWRRTHILLSIGFAIWFGSYVAETAPSDDFVLLYILSGFPLYYMAINIFLWVKDGFVEDH